MSTQKNTICPACQSKLKIIYYQRRAADEPPDKVVYCDNCPLDTGRLKVGSSNLITNYIDKDTAENVSITSIKNKRNVKKEVNERFSKMLRKEKTTTCIKVEGMAAQRCYKKLKDTDNKSNEVVGLATEVIAENKRSISYYYCTSALKGKALVTTEKSTIAPYVEQRSVDIYTAPIPDKDSIDKYVLAYEYILPTISYCDTTVLRTSYNGQKPYIFIVLSDDNTNDIILSILQSILVEFGTEPTAKSIISNTVLNTLYIQSGRAYDHPFAPESGFRFTWKPDGERFWYIKYGSVWLYCRRLLSGRIAGWNLCTTLQSTLCAGPILDVEVLIAHDPILIFV